MGFVHSISGPQPDSSFVPLDGGIALFSKHPMAYSSTHRWRRQASWDTWASKGIVHALIDVMPADKLSEKDAVSIPPAKLHIITLHAQAAHLGWQDTAGVDLYRDVRIDQMRQ